MKSFLLIALIILHLLPATAQDTSKTCIAAFPITAYIVPLDSVQVVQVELPAGLSIAEKQIALLKGIYRDGKADTATVGRGRCNLIKGNYYYFTMHLCKPNRLPAKGDLIYTRINKTGAYFDRMAALALHAVTLQNVYGENLYEPLPLLMNWTKANEIAITDSLVADIRFTGPAMKEQMPANNIRITEGKYKGKLLFDLMEQAKKEDVESFLDYMIARPNNYSGNAWKISEIFATWANAGAPVAVK